MSEPPNIRKGARIKGRCEIGFWRPIEKTQARFMLFALERWARAKRQRGERFGPLGPYGFSVFRALLRRVNAITGQLDPTLETIAKDVGCCVSAVVAALKRLRAHGFLAWITRFKPSRSAGMKGPQVEQTSNAYALTWPAAAAAFLEQAKAPEPEDFKARRTEAAAALRQMAFEETPAFDILERWGSALNRKK